MDMNTQKLMDLALQVAGMETMPNDCDITVAGDDIKKVLMGVDMDTPELLLAKQLGFDCVVTHHPRNTNPDIGDVLNDHIFKLEALGVPRNKAQKVLAKRKDSLSYRFHVSNSRRSESAAKLLNMPYMSIHTPADLIGEKMVQDFLDEKFVNKPETTLDHIVNALEELPEYKNSVRKPIIRVGSKDSYAGKIYVLMSGLTGPGADVLKAYFEAGVGTLVMMHIPEEDVKPIVEQAIGNVIIAGHMSSDSLGMNKIAQKWEEFGVEVTMASGVVTNK